MSKSTVMTLADYVLAHTVRGECQCGHCVDKGDKPDPSGHTVDMHFFKVASTGEAKADEVLSLARSHKGEFCDCDPFDGAEHGYMELGGWIGDQGLAMQFMALCELVGLAKVLTPARVMPFLPKELLDQMAGGGMVTMVKA